MLKLCQLREVFCEVVVTVSCEPLLVAVAEPPFTVMPVGLAIAFRAMSSIKTAAANRRNMGWQYSLRIIILIFKLSGIAPGRTLQIGDMLLVMAFRIGRQRRNRCERYRIPRHD